MPDAAARSRDTERGRKACRPHTLAAFLVGPAAVAVDAHPACRARPGIPASAAAAARSGDSLRPSSGDDVHHEGRAMRYLLLICADETAQLSPGESAAMGSATGSWVAEMDGRGVRLQGDQLQPVSEAATVQVRGGEVLVSDGPFAETKEQIAGFDVLECADLDEAIEVASRHPVARIGTVEVRPFWQE